jgi:chaperonin GroEL (HSP60 family)
VSSNSDSEITRILREVYAQNRQQMSAISIGNTERVFQDKPRLEIIQGYSFDQGFLSPYFTTDKAKS